MMFCTCVRATDYEVKEIGKFKVGDCFTAMTNIYAIDGQFRTEEGNDLEQLKQWATNFNKSIIVVPIGTTFQLKSVTKHSEWSWNTGFYTYYTIKLIGLDKEFKGQQFDASALSYRHETRISYEWEFGDIPERTSEWPVVKHYPQRIILKKIISESSSKTEKFSSQQSKTNNSVKQ